jgi:predicted transcriptional regulator
MSTRQPLTEELPACRVDPDLKQAVLERAEQMDRPVSFVQRAALRAYLTQPRTNGGETK